MGRKQIPEEELLLLFWQKHGNKYKYSPLPNEYKMVSVMDITCPVHGIFHQSIRHHKNGQGCPKCGKQKVRNSAMLGRSKWIRRFESIHGRGQYDYSKIPEDVIYNTKVEIYCFEHNLSFYQTPDRHWRFKQGCPECGKFKQVETRKQRLITRGEYERKARRIHGMAFDYSELPLKFSLKDIIIVYSNEHNHVFFCVAQEHLCGKNASLRC